MNTGISEDVLKEMSFHMADAIRDHVTYNCQDVIAAVAADILSKYGFEPDSEWDDAFMDKVTELTTTIHVVSQFE